MKCNILSLSLIHLHKLRDGLVFSLLYYGILGTLIFIMNPNIILLYWEVIYAQNEETKQFTGYSQYIKIFVKFAPEELFYYS